jgi:hypothetical protein
VCLVTQRGCNEAHRSDALSMLACDLSAAIIVVLITTDLQPIHPQISIGLHTCEHFLSAWLHLLVMCCCLAAASFFLSIHTFHLAHTSELLVCSLSVVGRARSLKSEGLAWASFCSSASFLQPLHGNEPCSVRRKQTW